MICYSNKNILGKADFQRNCKVILTSEETDCNCSCTSLQLAEVVRESGESIGKLAESSDQIGEIVGVIDDIADQQK